MDMSKKDYKEMLAEYILIAVLLLIIGLLIGFGIGSYITIKAVASIAGGFVDEEMLTRAIYQYRSQIGACFPANFSNPAA